MQFTLRFSLLLIIGGFSFLRLTAQKSPEERPNIIFILTDDQSYGYMGCTGNAIVQTPNLDQLAADGTLFTNAHISSAICTPSRVSILTGQFERKHGVNFNSGTSLNQTAWQNTYPMRFRQAGYYTGYVGKNHSPVGKGGYQSKEIEKSFDYWYAGHRHLGFYPKDRHEIFQHAKNDTQLELLEEGINDFLDDNPHRLEGALHFMDQRPAEKPFILSLCFNLPHGAGTSSMEQRKSDPEIYKSLYRDQEIPLPQNYVAKSAIRVPRLPAEVLKADDRQDIYDYVDQPESLKERYIRQLQAMTGIDQLVGRLRDYLKKNGLSDNTIIVFSSDHGLLMGQYGLGGKALCYEICTHVPLIVYHPGINKQSASSSALVQSIDIAPSMLRFAGLEIPESMQGKDFGPLLKNGDAPHREYLFTENLWSTQFGNPRCESVQNQEWKYIRYYQNHNFSAREKIKTAKAMGINVSHMLYRVHDPDIAIYRIYVEAPFRGEKPVYEELFHLKNDPGELLNQAYKPEQNVILEQMRTVCDSMLHYARGQPESIPEVLRYTNDMFQD